MNILKNDLFTTTGAEFSKCGKWRYDLWRRWGNGPTIMWLLLNPSTADEVSNDPTVERCQRRTQWLDGGVYGACHVCNIFAFRSTNPANLYREINPIGPYNDHTILKNAQNVDRVICGWGNHGQLMGRGEHILNKLFDLNINPECLTVTKAGQPGHPLYISYQTQPFAIPISS